MAIDEVVLRLIRQHIKGARILCLSYPDILIPIPELEQALGIKVNATTHRGSFHKRKFPLAETRAALLAAGASSVQIVDFVRQQGSEDAIVDLNFPHDLGKYELVLNPGTLEHCFNVGTAWKTAWDAVAVEGYIVHVAPLSLPNHGFWSMNPTLYHDFAAANGGSVNALHVYTMHGAPFDSPPYARFAVPEPSVLYCKMRKETDQPFRFPVQRKYQ